MRKEMPYIPVSRVVHKKIIIGKNGGPRRRRGTGVDPQKNIGSDV
jgi:GTPase Era involved in 16S rRNA processing